MEYNIVELPTEVWSHILSFVENFDTLTTGKFVNRIFYQELAHRDIFKAFDRSIKFSKEISDYFVGADNTYSLPRAKLLDALQRRLFSNYQVSGNCVSVKTVIIGQQNVGKTTFFSFFVRGVFQQNEHITIGSSFFTKRLEDPDGVVTKFELWDTAGQERFRDLPKMYYRGAHALLLCFSIDSRESVAWLLKNTVPQIVQAYGAVDRPVTYLVGLKSDLESKRQVSVSEAKALARALKLKYFECSAKECYNINEIMAEMKDDVLKSLRVPDPSSRPEIKPGLPSERRWCSIQ